MNGYNFTERVRKVLAMAREEAARLHHEYVGTEHILLGLIREGEGVAATVLQNLSVELDELEQVINDVVRKGTSPDPTRPDLPYTSRAKKVLELAMAEAREVNHSYVGTEHLLMGLLREEKGIAAQVLIDAGVTVDAARAEMLRILGTETPRATPRPPVQRRELSAVLRPTTVVSASPRFMERLRKVIADSHRVAADRQTTEVSPVHIALALLQHGRGVANAALARLGLNYESTLLALNDLAPLGTAVISPETVMMLNPESIAVLQTMEDLQHTWRNDCAGTQHLLLALLSRSAEVALVFDEQRITLEDVTEEIRAISG